MAITPVIVAVADVKNKNPHDAKEPADLMFEAISLALQDSLLPPPLLEKLKSDIDSIDVVRTWTWPYRNLPQLLANKLNALPSHSRYTEHGGNQPAKVLDEAAIRIASGESKVAVITGGEALASLARCSKIGEMPPPGWTETESTVTEVFTPTNLELDKDIGGLHGIGTPIQIYPLYETAFRAYRGQSIEQNNEESATLYSQFSQIAAQNPYSWSYGEPVETKQSIGTVSQKNRMICLPYPLLMNAFNTVNLAAACILTSTEYASSIGIPESRWVYPLGGAGAKENDQFWNRETFVRSRAICETLDQCLQYSGLNAEDIDLFDFYSCFPIVPKLACHHLGISIFKPEKPITLLGGLTSFGGAGNNYSMHAITEMVRRLRTRQSRNGLILANGGFLTYQHAICLSTQPRRGDPSYPDSRYRTSGNGDTIPEIAVTAEGEAVIETYTVEFGRNGQPIRAYIIGRLIRNGHRFVANDGDQETLSWLSCSTEEPIGKRGCVTSAIERDDGHQGNRFFASRRPSL